LVRVGVMFGVGLELGKGRVRAGASFSWDWVSQVRECRVKGSEERGFGNSYSIHPPTDISCIRS